MLVDLGFLKWILIVNRFHFMAISDERQRIMPMPEDRETGQRLAYPEAVLLTNPINPDLRGEVLLQFSFFQTLIYVYVHNRLLSPVVNCAGG